MRITQNGVEIPVLSGMVWKTGNRFCSDEAEGVFTTSHSEQLRIGSIIDVKHPECPHGQAMIVEVTFSTSASSPEAVPAMYRFLSGKYPSRPDDGIESGITCGAEVLTALSISPENVRRFWIDVDVQQPTRLTLERLRQLDEPDGQERRDVTHFGGGGWSMFTLKPVEVDTEVHLLSGRTCIEDGCTVGEAILQLLVGGQPPGRRLRIMFAVSEAVAANVDVLVRRGPLREIVRLLREEKERMMEEACEPDVEVAV